MKNDKCDCYENMWQECVEPYAKIDCSDCFSGRYQNLNFDLSEVMLILQFFPFCRCVDFEGIILHFKMKKNIKDCIAVISKNYFSFSIMSEMIF